MAEFHKKPQAQNLRQQGETLKDIALQLGISKATAGMWCQDVELSSQAITRMAERTSRKRIEAQLKGGRTNRNLRLKRVAEAEDWAQKRVGSLSNRDVLIAGIGLYWGEGSKDRKLNFTNSDPALLMFMKRWFEDALGVTQKDFLVRVTIHESHKDRYAKVQLFWQRMLLLPARQFYFPTYLRTVQKKVYENRETYYGVLSLRIRTSTNLQYRILGLIKALAHADVSEAYVGVTQVS